MATRTQAKTTRTARKAPAAPAAPAAATTHPLPSYLDPNHLGPWGTYLEIGRAHV